jgi:predicted Rossmann fold flavoprotein
VSNAGSSHACDLAVVGAGAAGLAAAIFGAETGRLRSGTADIVLVDGATRLGAKILVSGGGRCNVTHETVTAKDFFGNRHIIKNVLSAFPAEATVEWFSSMGVELKREETGKLFPVSDKARTVLDALLVRCRDLGVSIRPDHRVTKIDHVAGAAGGFVISHGRGILSAKAVILATGGRSLPRTGSDGFGYTLARRLGHQITAAVPALVPLVLEDTMFHRALSGLSHQVELTTVAQGRRLDARTGSLLWTHFGISGPVVMDASRFWTQASERGERADLIANFLPGWTQEQTGRWLIDQAAAHPRRSLANTLALSIPGRLGEALCSRIDCDPDMPMARLARQDRDRLLRELVSFRFPVLRDRGWNHAEVTAGGVPLEEIDFRTMESKVVPGLYLIGEILDCDGRIGGFNFQWAWSTGYLAGRAAAGRLV